MRRRSGYRPNTQSTTHTNGERRLDPWSTDSLDANTSLRPSALTIVFGIYVRLAIGTSIVSVIATSSGAAAAYVRDRMTDMRVGMFLELATTSGAVVGALLAALVAPSLLLVLLGVVLLLSAAQQVLRLGEELPPDVEPSGAANRLRLSGKAIRRPARSRSPYAAQRVPLGFVLMGLAGLVSGLLGSGQVRSRSSPWTAPFGLR